MLTKITYDNTIDIPSILQTMPCNDLITLTTKPEHQEIHITFGGNLTFKQYKEIHHYIIQLNNLVQGKVDDSDSLLGYLQNKDGAYIVHNWKEWCTFLFEARLKSSFGENVQVVDEEGYILESGILVSYETDETNPNEFIITSCTLITEAGEQTITGDYLEIEALRSW